MIELKSLFGSFLNWDCLNVKGLWRLELKANAILKSSLTLGGMRILFYGFSVIAIWTGMSSHLRKALNY